MAVVGTDDGSASTGSSRHPRGMDDPSHDTRADRLTLRSGRNQVEDPFFVLRRRGRTGHSFDPGILHGPQKKEDHHCVGNIRDSNVGHVMIDSLQIEVVHVLCMQAKTFTFIPHVLVMLRFCFGTRSGLLRGFCFSNAWLDAVATARVTC